MRREQTEWNAGQMKLHFRVRERLALDDLVTLAGYSCRADVVRLALQRLADHYGLDRSTSVFAIRKRRDPRKASAA